MSQLTETLAQWDEEWQKIETPTTQFSDLPDGKYQARVDAVRLTETKSGKPALFWDCVVVSGDYAGRHIFRYNNLETVENLRWLKKDLATAGLTLEKLSDLEKRLPELLDVILELQLKTKGYESGEFQNVYINKRLGKQAPAEAHDEEFNLF